jgi:copper(I)-binding protein
MKTKFLLIFAAATVVGCIACAAAMPQAMSMPMVKPAVVPSSALPPVAHVHVDAAWVRAAPPGSMMHAGYMALRNDDKAPVKFEWAQSDVFGMVELHKTLVVNGVSTMRPAGVQTIPAGGTLRFEPGGLHLMLMQPQHELKIGDKVRFRLHFADGSARDVTAPVRAEAPAATSH